MSAELDWARHYVALGFSIMPLHHPLPDGECSCGNPDHTPGGKSAKSIGKHPVAPRWQERGVMTLEEATEYWTKNPSANIGLRMGGLARHVALDSDGEEGRASLAKLEAELGALPPTTTTQSGGGEHRIFTISLEFELSTITNSVKALAPGIDVRCEGGQVVAPPSLHYSGRRYIAIDTRAPAELPATWYERLPKRDKPPSTDSANRSADPGRMAQAAAHLEKVPPAIQGQGGSAATFVAAMKMVRGFKLTDQAAYEVLLPWNARCSPPWDEHDLRAKITSAALTGHMPWGALLAADAITFEILEAADIFAALPEIEYLVKGLGITPGAPALIAGYGYSGKTAAVQQMVLNLAQAEPVSDWTNPRPVWNLFAATKRAHVLHVDYEQGHRLTRRRYQRLAKAAGIDPRELEGWLRLVSLPELYLNSRAGIAALERLCEGIDLVIIDSFRAACPGLDENSSDAREPLDALNRISEKQGCSSAFIHHARKPSKDREGGSKMAIRGSGAIFDGSASVFVFEGEKDKPKKVSHEKERNSGVTVDDFELEITDVEGGGLIVRASNIVVKTAKEKSNEELQVDMAEMRAWLVKNLFFKNLAQIAKGLGISKTRASAAMGALETSGELIMDGSSKNHSYHLSGTGPINGVASVDRVD